MWLFCLDTDFLWGKGKRPNIDKSPTSPPARPTPTLFCRPNSQDTPSLEFFHVTDDQGTGEALTSMAVASSGDGIALGSASGACIQMGHGDKDVRSNITSRPTEGPERPAPPAEVSAEGGGCLRRSIVWGLACVSCTACGACFVGVVAGERLCRLIPPCSRSKRVVSS